MAKRKSTSGDDAASAVSAAEYTVLARRYRPQQFRELVGQEAVAQALTNAIESGRVAHAYLFTGARGVGKTSTARILAKALNCAKGPTPTPCDKCEICAAVAGGEDQDVVEIDGASNRRIDEIREVRQNVNYRPTRSRYKIYIIDEVHMLTKEAFNALLKTLEEPPPHVKFIFATTEVKDVPITILSRCQRFDFGTISINRILERLKSIVAAEGMQADDEALETVARRAAGSMRDAQSLLDQLLAFSGKKLTVDTVHQLLGTAHEERVQAIAAAVLASDAKQVLEILGDIANQGQQFGELLDQLIDYWRDLMIVNSAGITGQQVSVSSARRDTLSSHAGQAGLDTILAGMDILVTAKMRMRNSTHARTILELALVRLCQLDNLLPIGQIAQMLSGESGAAPRNSAPTQAAAKPAMMEKKKLTDDNGQTSGATFSGLDSANLSAIWQQLLTESGFVLRAELQRANPAISGPNSLVLRVSRKYNAPGCVFTDSARMGSVAAVLSRLIGQTATIGVDWTDNETEGAVATPRSPGAAAMGQQRQLRAELLQIPLVKKSADVLNAQIIRADDGFGAALKSTGGESEVEPDPEA